MTEYIQEKIAVTVKVSGLGGSVDASAIGGLVEDYLDTNGLNAALRQVAYAGTVNDPYQPLRPNFYIDLAGNIDLTISSISTGAIGVIKLTRGAGDETIIINGETFTNIANGPGVDVYFNYFYENDGLSIKPEVITASRSNLITNYKRTGNTVYDLIDQYTGEYFSVNKATTKLGGATITDADVTNTPAIYFKLGTEYFKRNFSEVDVTWFGADPTGVNNSSAAIQAAIAFAFDYKVSTLIIKGGKFKVGTTILFPENSAEPSRPFYIKGGGIITSTLNGFIFDVNGPVFFDLFVSDITFQGTASSSTKVFNTSKFIRLFTTRNHSTGIDWFFFSAGTGKYAQTVYSNNDVFRGAGLSDSAFFYAEQAFDISITNVTIEHTSGNGIVCEGYSNVPAANSFRISSSVLEDITGSAILLSSSGGLSITNNYFEKCGSYIKLDAPSATSAHLSPTIQANYIIQLPAEITANKYAIIWGSSIGGSPQLGGNYAQGDLHDNSICPVQLDVTKDFVPNGRKILYGMVKDSILSQTTTVTGKGKFIDNGHEVQYNQSGMMVFEPEINGLVVGTSASPTIAGQRVRARYVFGGENPQISPANYGDIYWAQGSIVFDHTSPIGLKGWRCITSGVPGTNVQKAGIWKAFGLNSIVDNDDINNNVGVKILSPQVTLHVEEEIRVSSFNSDDAKSSMTNEGANGMLWTFKRATAELELNIDGDVILTVGADATTFANKVAGLAATETDEYTTLGQLGTSLTITSPDATDLPTALTLLNEIKAKMNAL